MGPIAIKSITSLDLGPQPTTMVMASFSRLLTPMGRHHRFAAASVCTALFAASPFLLSIAPPTAFAFSHHQLAATRANSQTSTSNSITLKYDSYQLFQHYEEKAYPPINIGHLRSSSTLHSQRPKKHYDIDLTALPSDSADEIAPSNDSATKDSSSLKQDLQSIATLVGAQALLLPVSYFLAQALNVPNNGLGMGFEWTSVAAIQGIRWTLPLFAIAGIMRLIEPYSKALQGVTKATQRSVLAVMGKERRPVFALLVSILLGAVAGWGEEWLFRGVFQTSLSEKFSNEIALTICGIVFGLLHAVTPVYALLAGAASVFFGYLYNISENLAVPMICHAVYDVGALMWAHWSVTALSAKEQDDILESGPGAPIMDATINS
mmetsp:Transcript_4426/g.9814  ORF Transcript_4426/g.9814 Transcript_4426/m.9814 type:complete len:378 (-) Transcript_4426:72-1205(-)